MKRSKLILLSGIGTLFETFDFYIFALFALELNKAIFGGQQYEGLLWVFFAFASGYIARIFGALLFGYIGDKYSRKLSFQYTILVISISSIVIGLIPSYSYIGEFAIIMLFTLRIIQGFSYGGEMSGAIVIVSEFSEKWRGLSCGLISVSGMLGVLAAVLTHSIITSYLTPDKLVMYGWRIAFIFGGIIIFHSYFSRQALYDSPDFMRLLAKRKKPGAFMSYFQRYKLISLLCILMAMGTLGYGGIFIAYLPTYCLTHCEQFSGDISRLMIILMFAAAVGSILGGLLSEVFSYKKVYVVITIIGAALIVPAFQTISYSGYSTMQAYLLLSGCAIVYGAVIAIYYRYLVEIFPMQIRYTAVAIIYNIAVALFIGLSPAFLSVVLPLFPTPLLPAYLLLSAYCIQILFVLFVEIKRRSLPTLDLKA